MKVGAKGTRIENMRRLIRECGSQKNFADKAELAPAHVSQMVNGKRDMGEEVARRIEAAFGKQPGWIDIPQDSAQHVESDKTLQLDANVEPLTRAIGEVPLISYVQAGDWEEAQDPYPVGDAEDWLPCPTNHGPRAFALRVRGASMEKKFYDGDVIFVDPDREAINKSLVVVKLLDSNEVTFKQLIYEGEPPQHKVFLKALNEDWQPRFQEVDGRAKICGVVFWEVGGILRVRAGQHPIITDEFRIPGKVPGALID